jgi:hypothetical protein
VQAAAPELALWLQRAQHQLDLLGLVVSPEQRQQVALRMATAATALGRQEQQIEAGRIVPPLNFPEPPKGSSGAALALGDALTRWRSLRDPAPKTWLDAERRIGELAAFVGHDRLDLLTAEQVAAWRAQLIEASSTTTVKRKLGLIRAVLQAAAAGRTALVVSHRPEMLAWSQHVIVLRDGAVVEEGPPAALHATWRASIAAKGPGRAASSRNVPCWTIRPLSITTS